MARTKPSARKPAKPARKPARKRAQPAKTRTFDQLIAIYAPPIQALARAARTYVRELLPDAVESVDGSGPYIGYGHAPGYKRLVCTILVSLQNVKLGVARGASLPDPDGLLEGTGKVHRYVVMTSAADLRRPGVTALVRAASDRALAA